MLDATTGVDSTSGTVTLETAAPLKDAKSATIPNVTAGYLAESFTGTNDLYLSFYLRAASFPASARVVQIRTGTTTVGTLTLNSSGTLTLKNSVSSATIGTSSALSTNTLYRVGIRQSSGSGTGVLQAYLATGDAAFGSAFASSSAETISGQASEIRIGATNSNAVDATVDDIRLDTAAMPGPSGSGGATSTPTGPTATPTRTATPTNTPAGPTATPTLTPTPAPSAPPAYDETYTYDAIGNLLSKASVSYIYGPTNSGPHQARTVGGQTYSYDANGNLLSGGGRTFTWNADNLPASVTTGGVTESYVYDADGERVAKTVAGVTTVYFQGLWEQTVGGTSKLYYTLNGQVVAMRDSATNAVTYLHGDHLGSVSLATNSSGAVVSKQDFDPWGKARGTSTIAQTSLNYTGQRLDGTGLLYYHARYYDPVLARFVSADTVVPGSASGGMDGVALKGLTVDFHEPGFVSTLGQENGYGFWFQMSDEQRQQAGSPWGPANPQALDRYSYVLNNPLKSTDPTGHCIFALIDTIICAAVAAEVGGIIITAVVGTVVIIGAYEVGGALGRAQAARIALFLVKRIRPERPTRRI